MFFVRILGRRWTSRREKFDLDHSLVFRYTAECWWTDLRAAPVWQDLFQWNCATWSICQREALLLTHITMTGGCGVSGWSHWTCCLILCWRLLMTLSQWCLCSSTCLVGLWSLCRGRRGTSGNTPYRDVTWPRAAWQWRSVNCRQSLLSAAQTKSSALNWSLLPATIYETAS